MRNVMFGLTYENSNEEIQNVVFDKAHEARYFSIASFPAAGEFPGIRLLDFMRSKVDGLLYFGCGTGKTCGEDIAANPAVSLCGSFVGEDTGFSEHRSLIGFRISGYVRETDSADVIEEYWLRNPGSKKMWEGSMDVFKIYCLYKGEGELYQVYKNDEIYRLRFGFGGMEARRPHYRIDTDKCIGCGTCAAACTAGIIRVTEQGAAEFPHRHCYECGKCYQVCPVGAVMKE